MSSKLICPIWHVRPMKSECALFVSSFIQYLLCVRVTVLDNGKGPGELDT